jgi:hypothetical protein
MQAFLNGLNTLCKAGQKAGPYLLLEILLPGGSLCALLLFLWQRRHPRAQVSVRGLFDALMRTLAGACEPRLLVPMPARMAARMAKPASVERR